MSRQRFLFLQRSLFRVKKAVGHALALLIDQVNPFSIWMKLHVAGTGTFRTVEFLGTIHRQLTVLRIKAELLHLVELPGVRRKGKKIRRIDLDAVSIFSGLHNLNRFA